MAVTIYIWRAPRSGTNSHDAAMLHQYKDAQPYLYDLPVGWKMGENADGEKTIFDDHGDNRSLVVQGSGVAAVSGRAITWLRRTGSTRGDALRRARETAGMTMRQLAEAAGVSTNTVSLIEAGRSAPRADVLKALAAALGTSMDAIWE